VSKTFKKFQEAPGNLKKHQEEKGTTIINKQTKYSCCEATSRL
jgi:hypothetical protein